MIKILGLVIRSESEEKTIKHDISDVLNDNISLIKEIDFLNSKLEKLQKDYKIIERNSQNDYETLELRAKTNIQKYEKEYNKNVKIVDNIITLRKVINQYKQYNKEYLLKLINNLNDTVIFNSLIKNLDKSQNKVLKGGNKND